MSKPKKSEMPVAAATTCYASRFFRMQLVKFPLGDGTYQQCSFIGVDSHGVATVKTRGGRYRTVWDCNLYSVHNVEVARESGEKRS